MRSAYPPDVRREGSSFAGIEYLLLAAGKSERMEAPSREARRALPGEGVLNPNIEISLHREKKLSNTEDRCVRGVQGFLPCICFVAALCAALSRRVARLLLNINGAD